MADPTKEMEKFDRQIGAIRNADRKAALQGLRDEFEAAVTAAKPGFNADATLRQIGDLANLNARLFGERLTEMENQLKEAAGAGAGGPGAAPASPAMVKFDNFIKEIRDPARRTKIQGLRDEFEAASAKPGFNPDGEITKIRNEVLNVNNRQFEERLAAAEKRLKEMVAPLGAPPPAAATPAMRAFDSFVNEIRNPDRKADMVALRADFEAASTKPGFDATAQIKALKDVVQVNARLYTESLDAAKNNLKALAGPAMPPGAGAPPLSPAMKAFDDFVSGIRNQDRANDMRGLREDFEKASTKPGFDAAATIRSLKENVVDVAGRLYPERLEDAKKTIKAAAEAAPPPAAAVDPNMKRFDDFVAAIRNPERKAAISGLRAEFEAGTTKASFNLDQQMRKLEELRDVNGRLFPQKLEEYRSQLGSLARLDSLNPDVLFAATSGARGAGLTDGATPPTTTTDTGMPTGSYVVADAGRNGASRVNPQNTDAASLPKPGTLQV